MSRPLYPTPMGYSSKRPAVCLPPIDRGALIRDAQVIAHKARAYFSTPREALAYGLTAAWARVNARRSIQSLSLQVRARPKTPRELAASIRATRRTGSSFIGT